METYKTIRIEIILTEKEWAAYRRCYSEKEIKAIIKDGGLEELHFLCLDEKEYYDEKSNSE